MQPLKLTTSNLVYNLGLGSNLPRNNFYDQNGGPGLGAFKKFGTPYFFLVQLKLETSNLVYDLGLRVDYQETTFTTEIGGESGVGQHPKKIKNTLLISATVEASNFKFGIPHGYGEQRTRNNF